MQVQLICGRKTFLEGNGYWLEHIKLEDWLGCLSLVGIFPYERLENCLKNKQGCVIGFKNSKPRVFTRDNTRLQVFFNRFKISDIDQLIRALKYLDLGLFWSKEFDVKFSCVSIRYKDTH